MKITAVVEKEGGLFQFTADLTAQQHQFLIEYALRDLVTKGLVPFAVSVAEDGSVEASVAIENENAH